MLSSNQILKEIKFYPYLQIARALSHIKEKYPILLSEYRPVFYVHFIDVATTLVVAFGVTTVYIVTALVSHGCH